MDLNGDGVDDILAGVPWAEPVTNWGNEGAVMAFDGPMSGDYLVSDADHLLLFTNGSDNLGLRAALGDVDGDGYDDFMARDEAGEYILHGPLPDGTMMMRPLAVAKLSDLSTNVAEAGDVFGDGTVNFISQGGTYGSVGDYTTPFYVVPSDLDGSVSVKDVARATLLCDGSCGQLITRGMDTSAGGDYNGDGYADLLVGATGGLSGDPTFLFVIPGGGK